MYYLVWTILAFNQLPSLCYITTQRTKQTLLTKRERFISLSSTFEFVDLELLAILLDYVRAMDFGRIWGGGARQRSIVVRKTKVLELLAEVINW